MTNTGTNIGAFSFSDIVSKRQNVFESYDTCVSVSILTFLGMVIVNKVPHYRVTKLEPHTTDTQVRSGQLQFCHPNSEAPIIARKAIPKLTEMDKLPVLNTSDSATDPNPKLP